jgi:hypothetical protein
MTTIDVAKNQADKASLLPLKSIVDHAYWRGIKAFYEGEKKPHEFTSTQKIDVHRRAVAIKDGKEHVIKRLTDKLLDQHVVLEDHFADLHYEYTNGYILVEASNPYRKDSLYAKEWERGFNTGYHRNLKKITNKETKRAA